MGLVQQIAKTERDKVRLHRLAKPGINPQPIAGFLIPIRNRAHLLDIFAVRLG
jgi:hypothetical protein